MEWISVSDRLPKDEEIVLVWGGGFIELGWYRPRTQEWRADDFDYDTDEVTHWMPLPQPPKEDA